MLIEIHMIQNHSPSNINRDDLGAPKTCLFGGTLRARISSQCLKRSIRRSEVFRSALADWLGLRTKYFPDLVRESLVRSEIPESERAGIVTAVTGIARAEEKTGPERAAEESDDRPRTAQLIFLGPDEADAFVGRLQELRAEEKARKQYDKFVKGELKGKQLQQFHHELRKSYAKRSVDISLFGRMTTSEAFQDVEAAMEVAHAISTHDIRNEVDYFTAVDELATGTGGHVDENQFNSACYYKYFCLDWDMLVSHLAGEDPTDEQMQQDPQTAAAGQQEHDEAVQLAGRTLGHFIKAAALTVPSGKKKGHANNNPPDGILAEIKNDKLPISYANAFADAVQPNGERGLIAESIARLGHYVGSVVNGYGIDSTRVWFSPEGLPLEYVPSKEGEQGAPDALSAASRTVPSLDELIAATLGELGLDWAQLKEPTAAEAQ